MGFLKAVLPVSSFLEDLAGGLVIPYLEGAPWISLFFVGVSLFAFDIVHEFGVQLGVFD